MASAKYAFPNVKKDFSRNYLLYAMLIPVLAYYFIFHYGAMYGAIIAFKYFSPADGILRSRWVGLEYFRQFFSSPYCYRVIKNTLVINIYTLLFSFPAPIILALMLNEVRKNWYKRVTQTISYMPHFISLIVMCGMTLEFLSLNGAINDMLHFFGAERKVFMTNPNWFPSIYMLTDIWQSVGWGSIIYLSSITTINPNLYEACKIDGGGRFKQIFNITIPGILPTIIILLILRIGNILNVGFEKIVLLYNPSIYSTADVISSFVYRKGIVELNFSYGAAVGLFNSTINLILLISANTLSRKLTDNSLW